MERPPQSLLSDVLHDRATLNDLQEFGNNVAHGVILDMLAREARGELPPEVLASRERLREHVLETAARAWLELSPHDRVNDVLEDRAFVDDLMRRSDADAFQGGILDILRKDAYGELPPQVVADRQRLRHYIEGAVGLRAKGDRRDQYRRDKREHGSGDAGEIVGDTPAPEDDPDEEGAAGLRAIELKSLQIALCTLPDDEWDVIHLRLSGVTGKEVAQLRGISEATVSNLWTRGLRHLRERLVG